MNLQSRKLSIIQDFLNIQSEELISRIENILNNTKSNSKFKPMTMSEFNKRIDLSLEDSKNDRLTETNDLIEEIKEWN